MLRSASKFLLAPVLALAATGATLLVDVSAANAATTSAVRGAVKVRTGATNASAVVRTVKNKAKVSIDCRVTGQYIRGTVRKTAQWDRLTDGKYISHAYVV